jgi:hypothetical protein
MKMTLKNKAQIPQMMIYFVQHYSILFAVQMGTLTQTAALQERKELV